MFSKFPAQVTLSDRTSEYIRKAVKTGKVKFMDKKTAIDRINSKAGHEVLNHDNTHFSNVNSANPVWWFNIAPHKFKNDLHLLCAKDTDIIWLKIKADTFLNPEHTFRLRPDRGKIDLEISCVTERYMHDVKSGGTGYDFRRHIQPW